jgi:hypothetical protein
MHLRDWRPRNLHGRRGNAGMNDHFAPTERHLIRDLQAAARGPKRNGLFALWLFVRTCDGMLPPRSLSDRVNRRRLEGLKRRLSSLSLPPPLRRALTGSLPELETGTAEAASLVLRQLVAPVRDVLGIDTAEAVSQAAQRAKEVTTTEAADSR